MIPIGHRRGSGGIALGRLLRRKMFHRSVGYEWRALRCAAEVLRVHALAAQSQRLAGWAPAPAVHGPRCVALRLHWASISPSSCAPTAPRNTGRVCSADVTPRMPRAQGDLWADLPICCKSTRWDAAVRRGTIRDEIPAIVVVSPTAGDAEGCRNTRPGELENRQPPKGARGFESLPLRFSFGVRPTTARGAADPIPLRASASSASSAVKGRRSLTWAVKLTRGRQ